MVERREGGISSSDFASELDRTDRGVYAGGILGAIIGPLAYAYLSQAGYFKFYPITALALIVIGGMVGMIATPLIIVNIVDWRGFAWPFPVKGRPTQSRDYILRGSVVGAFVAIMFFPFWRVSESPWTSLAPFALVGGCCGALFGFLWKKMED